MPQDVVFTIDKDVLRAKVSHLYIHSGPQTPATGLYFTLRGAVYLPGESVLITDVGAFTTGVPEDAVSSLVCVTSNVNTWCCRSSDGGRVGEWFFPDGTMLPRNSFYFDFSRSGYTHQVRLNRRRNAQTPTGNFNCIVPDGRNSTVMHNEVITIIAGKLSHCMCRARLYL